MAKGDEGYRPVPTIEPKQQGAPELRIHVPHVEFTKAIGKAYSELGEGYQTLGRAKGLLGAAIGSAGEAISGVGNELFRRAMAMQEVKNEAMMNEVGVKYEMEQGLLESNYKTQLGNNAVGQLDKYMDDSQRLYDKYKNTLPSDAAKQMFDRRFMHGLGVALRSGGLHAATQGKAVAIDSADAEIAMAKKQIDSNPTDDGTVDRSLQRIENAVNFRSQLKGHSEISRQADLMKEKDQALGSQATGMAREQPFRAWDFFNKVKDQMTEDTRLRVEHTIMDKVRQEAGRSINAKVNRDLWQGKPDDTKSLRDRQLEGLEELKALGLENDEPARSYVKTAIDTDWHRYWQGDAQQRNQNYDNMIGILLGGKTDGRIPKNIDEVMAADPKARAWYDGLHDKQKMQFNNLVYDNYSKAMRVDPLTSAKEYERLRAMFKSDPGEFLRETDLFKLMGEGGRLNRPEIARVLQMRDQAQRNPNADPHLPRIMELLRGKFGAELSNLGVDTKNERTKDQYYKFTGALLTAIDIFEENAKRKATNTEIVDKIAPDVIKAETVERYQWNPLRLFSPTTTDLLPWQKVIPADMKESLRKDIKEQTGEEPSEEDLARAYVRILLLKKMKKPNAE